MCRWPIPKARSSGYRDSPSCEVLEDILIAGVDCLKGFPDAIAAEYPLQVIHSEWSSKRALSHEQLLGKRLRGTNYGRSFHRRFQSRDCLFLMRIFALACPFDLFCINFVKRDPLATIRYQCC